ncbi:hypothetical protein RSAG8_04918, partial [Rhizoctonia solani AG-8 WAC10335]
MIHTLSSLVPQSNFIGGNNDICALKDASQLRLIIVGDAMNSGSK